MRRTKRTAIEGRTALPVPDLVRRDFKADMPNTTWCRDTTYVAVGLTWLYLATVIDICWRRLSAGRSRITCAPRWSPTRSRCPWPPVAARSTASFVTRTGARDMDRPFSPRSAVGTASVAA
jgi:hypothetical protein